ncbi:MAG: Hsp70 family protein, partial [Polaromonas sp.]
GGTDFDKALSLASMMPMLGLGSLLKSGREMPSSHYFNLATWHTINLAYTKKAWAQITELHRDAADRPKMERLQNLVRERAGHWLALQVEGAKIALSDADVAQIDIGRISAGDTVTLHRAELDQSIDGLVNTVEQTVARLLVDAGITAAGIDTVFFTGGSSGVPLLRERVLALTPQARCVEGDLFGSIGAGLALDAQRKFA